MAHEPRLTQALRLLLREHRIAALGTSDEQGSPFVSMVPFAMDAQHNQIVIHVSRLASHTGNLLRNPQVSLMVMQAERSGQPVHDLPRVSMQGVAQALVVDSPSAISARCAYLARFPEAEMMTQLGDFCFVGITISTTRQVAGFGAARAVDVEEMTHVVCEN